MMEKSSAFTLEMRLGYHADSQAYAQYTKNKRVCSKLQDYITGSMNPEDIVCEQERLEEVKEIIEKIINTLPDKQSKVFQLIIIEGKKQEEAGKELNCRHQNISYHLKNAIAFIKEKFDLSSLHQNLITSQPTSDLGDVKYKIRYPSEFLSKLSTGGHKGKRVWVTNKKCVMDGYLDEAFGDTKTTCEYCPKCVNKLMKVRATESVLKGA